MGAARGGGWGVRGGRGPGQPATGRKNKREESRQRGPERDGRLPRRDAGETEAAGARGRPGGRPQRRAPTSALGRSSAAGAALLPRGAGRKGGPGETCARTRDASGPERARSGSGAPAAEPTGPAAASRQPPIGPGLPRPRPHPAPHPAAPAPREPARSCRSLPLLPVPGPRSRGPRPRGSTASRAPGAPTARGTGPQWPRPGLSITAWPLTSRLPWRTVAAPWTPGPAHTPPTTHWPARPGRGVAGRGLRSP